MDRRIIDIKDLKFGYSKSGSFLEDLNLGLKNGHIHGLLGKNGEGKSTLLKLMTGLLFPQHGSVEVLGFIPLKRSPLFLQDIYLLPEELPQFS